MNRMGTRWRGKIPVPRHAHPLVRSMVTLMNLHGLTFTDIEEDAGVCRATMSDWRYRKNPNIATFDAALNAMGYRLQIVEADAPSLDKPSYERAYWRKRSAA